MGIRGAVDLFSTYSGSASRLHVWLAGSAINTDLNLRLQYLAGMGAIYQNAPAIMQEIIRYREYPQDLFTGPPEVLDLLRGAIGGN